MRKSFAVVVFALFSMYAFAADGWISYFHNASLSLQYRYADCHDTHNGIHQQKVFLKFINLSTKKIEVSFTKTLQYTNRPLTNTDVSYQVTLNPQETKTGDCETRDKSFYIFSKYLNMPGAELTSFDLKNISVKVIE